jgi:ribosomal protein L17
VDFQLWDTVIDTSSIVCEEMCPLREKAITLEKREIVQSDRTVGVIRLPHVQRDLCNGCGKVPANRQGGAIWGFFSGEF